MIQTTTESSDSSLFRLQTNLLSKAPQAVLKLNNARIKFTVDTGSIVNIISRESYKLLPGENQKLKQCDENCALPIQLQLHKFKGNFRYKNKFTEADIYVINSKAEAIISYQTATELGLVKVTNSIT